MPKKKSKKRRLTKAERIARVPIEELTTLKGDEGRKQLLSYVRTLRTGYVRRVASFRRRGIYSYAQDAFERNAPEGLPEKLKDYTRNQLIGEIARYQHFFSSQTSSLEGINAVNEAQDARIFGEKKGDPIDTFTQSQRRKFWSLYDEYKNIYKDGIATYTSETVQQFLASAYVVDDVMPEYDKALFLEIVENMLSQEHDLELIEEAPSVYSGKGPDRPK